MPAPLSLKPVLFAATVPFLAAQMLFPAAVNAHHGKDFLLATTAHLPKAGEVFVISRQDYIDEDEGSEWELEPSLLFGVTDWFTFELHSHIEKENGSSFVYEATAPELSFRFTPRASAFSLGASIEYEFARKSEDDDEIAASLISGYEKDGRIFAFNITYERETGSSEDEWGYAGGARFEVAPGSSLGLEVEGSFEEDKTGEVLLGYYADFSDKLSLNIGVGTGFNDGVDVAARTAIIWSF